MHWELVNAVHTAVHCQMCVLECSLRNGKVIFIKTLRDEIRMSCTGPGQVTVSAKYRCSLQGFSLLNPRFLLSRAVCLEGLIQRFSVVSEMISENLQFYPENIEFANMNDLHHQRYSSLQFSPFFYCLLWMVTTLLHQRLLVPATLLFTNAQLALQINVLPGIIWMCYLTVLHMQCWICVFLYFRVKLQFSAKFEVNYL